MNTAVDVRTGTMRNLKQETSGMLVLTRRPTESLQIGEQIKVTVVSVIGRKVTLGIDAPAHVTILRTELLEDDDDA